MGERCVVKARSTRVQMRYHWAHGMLDLKAKLALAGLVTEEDIRRVEDSKRGKGKSKGGKSKRRGKGSGGGGAKAAHKLDVARLKTLARGEAYAAVRRWIERVRLDVPGKPPSEEAKSFHFPTAKGSVGRIVVEPDAHGWLGEGTAGVVAYMSNHGLAHAVVPADAARTLVEVFPLWLRALVGEARAGQIEEVPPVVESGE